MYGRLIVGTVTSFEFFMKVLPGGQNAEEPDDRDESNWLAQGLVAWLTRLLVIAASVFSFAAELHSYVTEPPFDYHFACISTRLCNINVVALSDL